MKQGQRKRRGRTSAPPDQPAPRQDQGRGPWWRWPVIAVCLLAGAGAGYFIFDQYVWGRLPSELVGTWGVQGGEQDGATLEFHSDGAFRARINNHGREDIILSRVTAEGDVLRFTSTHRTTGQVSVQTQTIKKLTATELVLEDGQGQLFRCVRLR
jgi:uncharacterized protein (TIGR03066 family)